MEIMHTDVREPWKCVENGVENMCNNVEVCKIMHDQSTLSPEED